MDPRGNGVKDYFPRWTREGEFLFLISVVLYLQTRLTYWKVTQSCHIDTTVFTLITIYYRKGEEKKINSRTLCFLQENEDACSKNPNNNNDVLLPDGPRGCWKRKKNRVTDEYWSASMIHLPNFCPFTEYWNFPCSLNQNEYYITQYWLFIAYSDERWLYYQFSLPHPYISLQEGWENVV